jgi:hypothetical protein
MTPKKKAKKTTRTPKEPKVPIVKYLIEDVDAAMSTEDLNTYCNGHGSQGWRLAHVGSTVRTSSEQDIPNQVRLWWMQ